MTLKMKKKKKIITKFTFYFGKLYTRIGETDSEILYIIFYTENNKVCCFEERKKNYPLKKYCNICKHLLRDRINYKLQISNRFFEISGSILSKAGAYTCVRRRVHLDATPMNKIFIFFGCQLSKVFLLVTQKKIFVL